MRYHCSEHVSSSAFSDYIPFWTKVERGTTVLYGKKLSGTTVLQLRYHRSERDAEKVREVPLFWKMFPAGTTVLEKTQKNTVSGRTVLM